MKTNKTLVTAITATIALFTPLFAEGKKGKCDKGRQKMIQQFDTDGDGQLNEQEKAAAKEAMQQRRETAKAKRLERFDTDGDGELSKEERKAAREAMAQKRAEIKAAVLENFDANGNGKLDEGEREGVREWVKENYPDAGKLRGKKRGPKGRKGRNGRQRGPAPEQD